ncbi:MAG TPA: vanadium-dependent haloperoxidase [Phycisphaerales bacterium]|nr:vanadium-dependent haloperoxidase [Phycisphaerales bacterium]HMP37402.1 vanadium-dependent haloperoxidase [Phycisphaerales bacterium]
MNRMLASLLAGALSTVAAADVIDDWNQLFLDGVRQSGGVYGPLAPVAPGPVSRNAAMMFTAMHDALNAVVKRYKTYAPMVPCPLETDATAAVAQAAHDVLVVAFPAVADAAGALLKAHLSSIPDGPGKESGIWLGTACANGLHALRADDGSEFDPGYVPGADPGDWQPTPPEFLEAWGPGWSAVTTWSIASGSQFTPSGPAGFTSMSSFLASAYYALQYEDAREYGDLFSTVRTADQTEIALFWANDRDGTFKPPGHLLDITQTVANDQGLEVVDKLRLFALVAIGMADAGIAAWDAKYSTEIDLWRPITGIRAGDLDGNPETVGDPKWIPLADDPFNPVHTPPFPAWVSGHATFGAVHAAVMRNFFGTDEISFTITSDDTPGVWRTYDRFSDAALENGRSRIYLGVHWQVDADDGYQVGTAVGDWVSAFELGLLGDLDGDGVVGPKDLGLLLAAFGQSGATDLNDDGVTDAGDLGILLANWR